MGPYVIVKIATPVPLQISPIWGTVISASSNGRPKSSSARSTQTTVVKSSSWSSARALLFRARDSPWTSRVDQSPLLHPKKQKVGIREWPKASKKNPKRPLFLVLWFSRSEFGLEGFWAYTFLEASPPLNVPLLGASIGRCSEYLKEMVGRVLVEVEDLWRAEVSIRSTVRASIVSHTVVSYKIYILVRPIYV